MNVIAAPFKQLVERRLWPLAVLLIAALAAVPMLLAHEPEAPAPSSVASSSAPAIAKAALATQPIVTVGDGVARDARRKVLGARKNPFKPKVTAKKVEAATAAEPAKPATSPETPVTVSPTTPTVVTPLAPKKTYELFSLRVRFGLSSDTELKARNLNRLKALPLAAFPALIYLGVLDDRRTAVFLVDHGATVQGDGDCNPSPEDCQTLHMRVGDIAFIDATFEGQQYQFQLELRKIRRKKTTDATALKATAKGGRNALRARVSRLGRLRYDAGKGTLKELSVKAYKAQLAR